MARVGFIGHPEYLNHDTGFGHPERPDRLRAIHSRLEESGLNDQLLAFAPRKADLSWLEKAHTSEHITNVRTRCEQKQLHMGDEETMICADSFEIARLSAGATLEAADIVMDGRADTAFCAVRPPGHHAERDRAMGFCLFNNAAIAARYIQETHNLKRILIVDWDVHHGNGTQHILEQDPTVFYFSIHQYPHYPWFSGNINETGVGEGTGATLNAPMEAGAGDEQYINVFNERLLPAMDRFKPEFVIISAGFDAHLNDPLSATRVTESGFIEMTRLVWHIAHTHANNRLLSVLEGGYDLRSLSHSTEAHLRTLLEA
ncbi:MAG: histone deacetylase [bacterium]|nr:histone deacetylase [bacterium]